MLTRAVLRVCLRTVFGWQRRRAARRGLVGARTGSITAIQRFGGSLNTNVHFHAFIFDGVYTRASPTARPVFRRLPPPTDADIATLLARVERRVRRLLVRRGRWPDDEAGSDPFAAQEPRFAGVVAASLQGRVALGPRAGQPVRRLRSAADVVSTGRRAARLAGFSLHADVAVPARRRDQLERLVRYLVRPPLAQERLTESTGGPLLYHFRRAWSDGSTALLLDPLELLERLPHACRRRGAPCSPTMASWRRAPVGELPSSRRRRRRLRARSAMSDPRGAGPGRGCSSGCSGLTSSCVPAVEARGASSAR
jgi:hypothetical protein